MNRRLTRGLRGITATLGVAGLGAAGLLASGSAAQAAPEMVAHPTAVQHVASTTHTRDCGCHHTSHHGTHHRRTHHDRGVSTVVVHNVAVGHAVAVLCPASHPHALGGGGSTVSGALTTSAPLPGGSAPTATGWFVTSAGLLPLDVVKAWVICAR